MARLAKSLEVLRAQINAAYPRRSKASDGWIGDAAHRATKSDHNPNPSGVVCALDITHDPKSGCDSYKLAEALRLSKDPRINYIISNRRICSSTVVPWTWRKYSGANAHTQHVHISVRQVPTIYDNPAPWKVSIPAAEAVARPEPRPPVVPSPSPEPERTPRPPSPEPSQSPTPPASSPVPPPSFLQRFFAWIDRIFR